MMMPMPRLRIRKPLRVLLPLPPLLPVTMPEKLASRLVWCWRSSAGWLRLLRRVLNWSLLLIFGVCSWWGTGWIMGGGLRLLFKTVALFFPYKLPTVRSTTILSLLLFVVVYHRWLLLTTTNPRSFVHLMFFLCFFTSTFLLSFLMFSFIMIWRGFWAVVFFYFMFL